MTMKLELITYRKILKTHSEMENYALFGSLMINIEYIDISHLNVIHDTCYEQ